MTEVDEILIHCTGARIDDITPDKHLVFDLMADSMMLIDISIELEQKFGFHFTEQHMQSVETVGDLYRIVNEYNVD